MNGKVKKSITAAVAAACAISSCACGTVTAKSTALCKPAAAQPLTYEQINDSGFNSFRTGVESFASKLTAATYSGKSYAVSPISAYMALSLAAQCAGGQTKSEILSALGADGNDFADNVSLLYRSLNETYTVPDGHVGIKQTGMLKPVNSIWVDDNVAAKQSCLNELAEKYFCYSYSADFKNDNKSANQAVREFVSEKTKGLIDKDFGLNTDTAFALINSLYLKDVWYDLGEDLDMTKVKYTFAGKKSKKSVNLLNGDYNRGRALVTDEYSAFYTTTANANKIKFIVPNDGYTIDQVFTAKNICAVNAYDFGENAVDHENKLKYYTECLFPEYKASYDGDIAPLLKSEFGIKQLFDANSCNLSPLTDSRVYCSKVKHVTDLTVNKKGIEGAAVTVAILAGAGAPLEDEYKDVYLTFTVDKSFGFIITNSYDTTLFSGVITDL